MKSRPTLEKDKNRDAIRGSAEQVVEFMGGRHLIKGAINSDLDVHDVIQKGLPGGVVSFMVKNVKTLAPEDVRRAVGVSVRTVQRRAGSPKKPLSQVQSGRAWKFAEIITKAENVLGSREEAERWMIAPALALDQRRPIDLLASPPGMKMVEDLLTRIQYSVYT